MQSQQHQLNIRLLFFMLCWLLCLQMQHSNVHCTHITGDFHLQHDFFKFLIKFGFDKSEQNHAQRNSYGYIYGNITMQAERTTPPAAPALTLVLLDKASFVDFYGNRSFSDHEYACQRMFSRLNLLAYDADCNVQGKRDFLRRIPCPHNQLCKDEDAPSNVISGNQFTYVVSQVSQPRFWYLSMVACYRNRSNCQWHASHAGSYSNLTANLPPIHYDIHVANAHPNDSAAHPLTFEFSFEQQNLLEMYLIFLSVYIVLLPMQIYAVRLQKHPVTKLFTLSLLSEFISLALISVHLIKFASNGVGVPDLQTAGDILDILSRTSFMLILLLLGKGWAVTRQQISRTGWIILMTIWVPYFAFHIFLYIWDRTEVDIISDVDEYQTWPGWIVLGLRTSFMLWFLYELRNTMKYEHSSKKLDFLLHLGASSLVWFIYLPIVAIVALQVSPMWRYKLLLGITNSADCIAYCVMTGLLWPNRVGQYLLLAGSRYAGMDELDEFNEAPHIVREREQRRNGSDVDVYANGGAAGSNTLVVAAADATHATAVPTGMLISNSLSHSMNGEVCTGLLSADDLDVELLTDLHKHANAVA